jgi:hypothetical protein
MKTGRFAAPFFLIHNSQFTIHNSKLTLLTFLTLSSFHPVIQKSSNPLSQGSCPSGTAFHQAELWTANADGQVHISCVIFFC